MNCRLCLNKCKVAVSIFADNDVESLLKLILKYLYLKIQPDDLYSTNLCQNCTKNLQDFHNFFQCAQRCKSSLQPAQKVLAETSTLESVQWDSIFKKASGLETSKPCGLCKKECENAVPVITDQDEISWLRWIEKYLFVKFEPDKVYSISMCRKCAKSLQDFHNFYQCVQDCQFTLRNMNISENEKTTTLIDSNEQSLILKRETEQEFLENDDNENSKDCHLAQFDQHHIMDESFSDISVKTKILSAEEASESYEIYVYLEASGITNKPKNTVPENDSITCGTCGAEFGSKELLINHFKETECKQQVANGHQTCSICSKAFETIEKLKRHMYVIHNEKNDDIVNRTCPVCSKVCASFHYLKHHIRYQHNRERKSNEHTCQVCSKVFNTVRQLKTHMRHAHNPKEQSIEARTCSLCSKVFETIRRMKDHMYVIHHEKNDDIANRTCFECTKVYASVKALNQHTWYRHNSNPEAVGDRTCHECSKVFDTIGKLKSHTYMKHNKRNEDIANRTCSICSKVSSTVSALKRHMRFQHNTKKEAIEHRTCTLCSKVLSTVLGLKRHILVQHTGNQEDDDHRTCRICSKIFDTIGKLKYHMYVKHNKRNEDIANRTCTICSTVLSSVYGMKHHIYLQHNTKQEAIKRTCPICSKVYDKYHLNSHMLKEHKDSEEAITMLNIQNAKTVGNIAKLNNELSDTHGAKWSADLQVKEEEPFEIHDFLEEFD